tara:strand:- start:465 stop:665 length:201 start_codon:yes stop_codon:yes gene_type:complete
MVIHRDKVIVYLARSTFFSGKVPKLVAMNFIIEYIMPPRAVLQGVTKQWPIAQNHTDGKAKKDLFK